VEIINDGGDTVPTLRRDGGLAESGRGLRLVSACSVAWGFNQSAARTVTWFACAPEPRPPREANST